MKFGRSIFIRHLKFKTLAATETRPSEVRIQRPVLDTRGAREHRTNGDQRWTMREPDTRAATETKKGRQEEPETRAGDERSMRREFPTRGVSERREIGEKSL